MYQENIQGVSRKNEGCLDGTLRMFQGNFDVISKNLKGVSSSKKFKGSLKPTRMSHVVVQHS